MEKIIDLKNGLYVDAAFVVKEIITQILKTIKDGKISYDMFSDKISDTEVYRKRDYIIISKGDSYDYHKGLYTSWIENIYSDDPGDLEKFKTCKSLQKLYGF